MYGAELGRTERERERERVDEAEAEARRDESSLPGTRGSGTVWPEGRVGSGRGKRAKGRAGRGLARRRLGVPTDPQSQSRSRASGLQHDDDGRCNGRVGQAFGRGRQDAGWLPTEVKASCIVHSKHGLHESTRGAGGCDRRLCRPIITLRLRSN